MVEILRDILNGKIKIVQNCKSTESDTEEEVEDDDEEMPEAEEIVTQKMYDTSERTDDMRQCGQIRKRTQYNYTQTVRYRVRT